MHKGAQSNHKASTKTWPAPSHSHPNHLIKRGSQTACNCKLDYHDSCALCEGSTLYLWVVISSQAKRLYTPPFCQDHTDFGVWLRDHYMLLQRSTTGVCYALLRFPNKRSPLAVTRFPAQTSPLAPYSSGSLQSMSQRLITKYGTIPTQPSTTHNL
jgi:hypothetical protein